MAWSGLPGTSILLRKSQRQGVGSENLQFTEDLSLTLLLPTN